MCWPNQWKKSAFRNLNLLPTSQRLCTRYKIVHCFSRYLYFSINIINAKATLSVSVTFWRLNHCTNLHETLQKNCLYFKEEQRLFWIGWSGTKQIVLNKKYRPTTIMWEHKKQVPTTFRHGSLNLYEFSLRFDVAVPRGLPHRIPKLWSKCLRGIERKWRVQPPRETVPNKNNANCCTTLLTLCTKILTRKLIARAQI